MLKEGRIILSGVSAALKAELRWFQESNDIGGSDRGARLD